MEHCAECCPNRKPKAIHHGWSRKVFETMLTVLTTALIVLLLKAAGI